MPKRAIAALVTTALAVVLLLSFRTPSQQISAVGGQAAIIGPASVATTAPSVATAPPAAAGSGPSSAGTTTSLGSGAGGTAQGAPAAPAQATPAPAPTPGLASKANATVTGPTVDTPFGPVQVRATISGGKIVDVAALQTPSDRTRSQMIAQYAVPILRQEALQAQSANIDIVSGATYTSMGYAQSLQGALDQVHA